MIEEYKEFLKHTKKLSDSTIQSYMRDMKQFEKYIQGLGILDLLLVTRPVIVSYLDSMQKAGKANASILRTIATFHSFYGGFLADKIEIDPTSGLEIPKPKKRQIEFLTSEEVDLLMSQPQCDCFKGYRDKAMLELLYATGIRVSELISLQMQDVNLQAGCVICHSNGKQRIVPMGSVATAALAQYLEKGRQLLPEADQDILFVNVSGKGMSRQGFWKIIKHYKEKAKIKKEITPQILRHSFAVHLIENGADVQCVQELLGHTSVTTTKVYTKLVSKRIDMAYKMAHPRA